MCWQSELFRDVWWMQHSVPEICWLDLSTFRWASLSYKHLIPAGKHYYCLSACVRNSLNTHAFKLPVTLLRKSSVNVGVVWNCLSAAVERLSRWSSWMKEWIIWYPVCITKEQLHCVLLALMGFKTWVLLTWAMSVIVMIEGSKTSTIEHLVYSDLECRSQFSPTMISS